MATGRLDIDEAYDLPPRARRELELFVHRCMRRLEADATLEAWCVSLTAPTQASFRCAIEIKHHGRTLQKHGDGSDVVVAAWNAICGIEAALLAEAVRSPRSS
jgi:hypothetical protein